MPEIKKLASGTQVALGFLLGGTLNQLVLGAGLLVSRLPGISALGSIGLFGLVFFGVAQLIWQAPLVWFLRSNEHKNMALGVIIAASITCLLNGICWLRYKGG